MVIYFGDIPNMKLNKNGHKFQLEDCFIIMVDSITVTIPIGFYTDLASTGIFSPLNKTAYPAILHDYLYSKQRMGYKDLTRKKADMIFRDAMITTKVNVFKRNMYYYGVRCGGWVTWNKYKKARRKKNEKIHRELLNKIDNKI